MRILHVDPDDIDNPLSGGGPVRTFEICRRLARRHDVTVLTPTFPGSTAEKVREGIRYVRLGRRIGDHGSSHHITFFFALPRAIRRFDHDLLVEDFMPPASVTMTPLVCRKPLIASVQWFFAESLSRQYHLPFYLGERYGIRMYRNFVVLTRAMQELIQSRHPRARCEVIPNGVDAALYDIAPRYDGDFILYIGRIDFAQKGIDLLIEAYARVPEDVRLPLVMAGDGFEMDRLRTTIASLGLTNWVRLEGKVGAAQRAELLRDCRYVCIPSREETFGMVILEACAAAKPVIVFDKWPMNEVAVRGGCELVPPFDIDAFGCAMVRLATEDAGRLAERGRLCRQRAGEYRWDEIARRQEAFYESVLSEARSVSRRGD
ncbi:MAG: glycosyltransferase family 4 protein [Caenispirillum sp.]|nr:glycosyltransferase family 4 protein [Caenispirillum sp.]